MSGHTPEPWVVRNVGSRSEPMMNIYAARIAGREPRHHVAIVATGDSPQPMEDANAARIVSCVNALAGIPDPEAAIKAVREALELVALAETFGDEYGLYLMPHTAEKCLAALRLLRGDR